MARTGAFSSSEAGPSHARRSQMLSTFTAWAGGKYVSIAPAWPRAWQEVIPFFAFDPAIPKIIYTANAIESLNRVFRKSNKTRGSFPTEDAATKLIYLAIRNFEKGGRIFENGLRLAIVSP
ncbi:MAG: transposase [Sulfitobacter sp.]